MAKLVKQWEDGTSLSVAYDGSGAGDAVFSSDQNEGIDREMSVVFSNAGGASAERKVKQEGLRQRFITADGKIFYVSDGLFAVLKRGGIEPPQEETYTRLAYIESTGEQYINLNYIVQEADEIEIRYAATQLESGRLYGAVDSAGNSIYYSFSNKNAYARFGSKSSTTLSNGIQSNRSIVRKKYVAINTYETTMPYVAMPDIPLCLFACGEVDGTPTALASFRCFGFELRKAEGETLSLLPFKRNSDGAIGLLDSASGSFYTNEGSGADFIAGAEIILASGYELIDAVTFNAEKCFDMGVMTQDSSIEIMYQRENTTASQYLYGIINDGNTKSFTAYMASNGAWRFGNQLVRPNTGDRNVHRTFIANGSATHDSSKLVINASASFTTEDSVILGGYRDAAGAIDAQFEGKVFYVRLDNGETFEWYPCKRIADGIEGFWDCKKQAFVEQIN